MEIIRKIPYLFLSIIFSFSINAEDLPRSVMISDGPSALEPVFMAQQGDYSAWWKKTSDVNSVCQLISLGIIDCSSLKGVMEKSALITMGFAVGLSINPQAKLYPTFHALLREGTAI